MKMNGNGPFFSEPSITSISILANRNQKKARGSNGRGMCDDIDINVGIKHSAMGGPLVRVSGRSASPNSFVKELIGIVMRLKWSQVSLKTVRKIYENKTPRDSRRMRHVGLPVGHGDDTVRVIGRNLIQLSIRLPIIRSTKSTKHRLVVSGSFMVMKMF